MRAASKLLLGGAFLGAATLGVCAGGILFGLLLHVLEDPMTVTVFLILGSFGLFYASYHIDELACLLKGAGGVNRAVGGLAGKTLAVAATTATSLAALLVVALRAQMDIGAWGFGVSVVLGLVGLLYGAYSHHETGRRLCRMEATLGERLDEIAHLLERVVAERGKDWPSAGF